MAKNTLWKIAELPIIQLFKYSDLFSRYGGLKLKFLCERIFYCIYSFCSIDFTKTAVSPNS